LLACVLEAAVECSLSPGVRFSPGWCVGTTPAIPPRSRVHPETKSLPTSCSAAFFNKPFSPTKNMPFRPDNCRHHRARSCLNEVLQHYRLLVASLNSFYLFVHGSHPFPATRHLHDPGLAGGKQLTHTMHSNALVQRVQVLSRCEMAA
jgi:hypothetical protein